VKVQACRNVLRDIFMPHGDRPPYPGDYSHPGLLLARCLIEHDSEKEFKRELLRTAEKAQRSRTLLDVYRLAYARCKASLPQPCSTAAVAVDGRLIVGLGAESVLETGVRLHHTYGVPVIPGSALKGLAAHYCDRVWGAADKRFDKEVESTGPDGKTRREAGEYYRTLFGTTKDAGHILFHDAWITPESLQMENGGLALDVMTPHHRDYYSYSGKSDERTERPCAPTDFDDPNPVTFVSVTGEFLVAVSCDVAGEEGKRWASLALELLTEALREWGVGGKTSSGYGRLVRTSGEQPRSAPPKPQPRFGRGEKVTVKRTGKTTRKGQPLFEAPDGVIGFFLGSAPPAGEPGEEVEAWIANLTGDRYQLSMTEVTVKGGGKKRRR